MVAIEFARLEPDERAALEVVEPKGTFQPGDRIFALGTDPVEGAVLASHSVNRIAAFDRLVAIGGHEIHSEDDAELHGIAGEPRHFEFLGADGRDSIYAVGLYELGPDFLEGRRLLERVSVPNVGFLRDGQWHRAASPAGLRTRAISIPRAPELEFTSVSPGEWSELAPGDYLARVLLGDGRAVPFAFSIERRKTHEVDLDAVGSIDAAD